MNEIKIRDLYVEVEDTLMVHSTRDSLSTVTAAILVLAEVIQSIAKQFYDKRP